MEYGCICVSRSRELEPGKPRPVCSLGLDVCMRVCDRHSSMRRKSASRCQRDTSAPQNQELRALYPIACAPLCVVASHLPDVSPHTRVNYITHVCALRPEKIFLLRRRSIDAKTPRFGTEHFFVLCF